MSSPQSVVRDERTVAVENASYRWPYILLTYALLIDVVYRGLVRHEAAWDLMALVIVGSAVCTMYQARQKTLPPGWVKGGVLIACFGGVIAAAVAVVLAVTHTM
ncbi:MAG: hypothetical protein JXQ73_33685 [Phycisphaerae bacterium]|nr:hypothetical protein [Phycisphaerae bacterium]